MCSGFNVDSNLFGSQLIPSVLIPLCLPKEGLTHYWAQTTRQAPEDACTVTFSNTPFGKGPCFLQT